MANVNLYFFSLDWLLSSEFFPNLKEALFDLSFDAWFELFLHIIKLEVLSFEILERIAFLLGVTSFHVFHNWFTILQLMSATCFNCAVSLCWLWRLVVTIGWIVQGWAYWFVRLGWFALNNCWENTCSLRLLPSYSLTGLSFFNPHFWGDWLSQVFYTSTINWSLWP